MIITKKLLGQWIDVQKLNDQEIATALNNLGFEVEKVINLQQINTKLIAGELTKIEKHPKADRLSITKVNIGTKILNIICGAKNINVGDKVIVAQIGSVLGNGMEILPRELQGISSEGMICSLSELGIQKQYLDSIEAEGIYQLPKDIKPGDEQPLASIGFDDTIFEIQLTLNRSDCLAMNSLAKELSAYFNLPLKPLLLDKTTLTGKSIANVTSKNIKALAVAELTIKPGTGKIPIEVKRMFQLASIKSNSILEDAINLAMLELGQPVIGFDSSSFDALEITEAKVKDKKTEIGDLIFIEKDKTLDIFGSSAQINKDTTKGILLSINPDLVMMQKQLKKHGNPSNVLLQRISKPIVFDHYLIILQRIFALLNAWNVEYQIISLANEIPYNSKPMEVSFAPMKINQILGTDLKAAEIMKHLEKIGCQEVSNNKEMMTVILPTHRNDLVNVQDFSEEIARIIGYDNLPTVMPQIMKTPHNPNPVELLVQELQTYFLNHGFHQTKTYSLTSEQKNKDFNFFHYRNAFSLVSPINQARKVMRLSLVESLWEICQYNVMHKQHPLRFFTDAKIYFHGNDMGTHHFSFMIAEPFLPQNIKVNKQELNHDFYLVKKTLETVLVKYLNINQLDYEPISDHELLHPYLSANINYQGKRLGIIATFRPNIVQAKGLNNQVSFVEINCHFLAYLITKDKDVKRFKAWSKFNPLRRDISLIVPNSQSYAPIKKAILDLNLASLVSLHLDDVYIDEKLKLKNEISLTFNLQFNSHQEQLDEDKVKPEIAEITKLLINKFKATIR